MSNPTETQEGYDDAQAEREREHRRARAQRRREGIARAREVRAFVAQAERDRRALDRLSDILTTHGEPWPSGADFLEWAAEIVASTGRSAE